MQMLRKLKDFPLRLITVSCALFISAVAQAGVNTTETQKYLVIATGEGTSGSDNSFVSFNMSNVELGADQEVVSNSSVGDYPQRVGGDDGFKGGLDLTGDWVPNDGQDASQSANRFNDNDPDHSGDTVGVADIMPGARPVYEGIDYSGNVALTGQYAELNASNTDTNATTGIQCNRSAASCFANPSDNNSFFQADGDSTNPNAPGYDPYNDTQQDLNNLEGISQFTPTTLLAELEAQRDWIVGLTADTTFDATFSTDTFNDNKRNIKDSEHNTNINDLASIGQAAVITDLDAIDAAGNSDGIAVIDIDMEGAAFVLNNTDWILQTTMNTLVIFRMIDGSQYDFDNSSILLGDGTIGSQDVIDEMGAIFFIDAKTSTNEVFDVDNAILGGIGLWDLTDFNSTNDLVSSTTSEFNPAVGGNSVIDLSNAQGCAQFISNQVLMSNNRWNRCAMGSGTPSTEIPEPNTIFLISTCLLGILFRHRASA